MPSVPAYLHYAPPTNPYLPNEPEVLNATAFADGNVRQALLDAKGLVQRSLHLVAG